MPSVGTSRTNFLVAYDSFHLVQAWIRLDHVKVGQLELLRPDSASVASPAHFPKDQTQRVDISPFPRVEMLRVERLIEQLWWQVSFGAHFGVVWQLHSVGFSLVLDAEAKICYGASQIFFHEDVFRLEIPVSYGRFSCEEDLNNY